MSTDYYTILYYYSCEHQRMIDMTLFDRVKKLADNQGKSLKTVALDLGFGENSLYGWKTKNPGIDKLQSVADYFNVSTDYLLGRENLADTEPVHIDVDDIINNMAPLTQRDHALSDEDQAAIRALVKTYLNSKEGQNRLRKYGGYGNDGKKIDKE